MFAVINYATAIHVFRINKKDAPSYTAGLFLLVLSQKLFCFYFTAEWLDNEWLQEHTVQQQQNKSWQTLSVSQNVVSGLEEPSFETNFKLHKSLARSGSF